ncbi:MULTISPECIES: nuclear transport factor 2 family protein [Sphingobium]|uniref:nuclear transport factor 2 family protein n=1 Tax=Sphingobium sp. MI1205 TaxID=407020 RepID=UPI0007706C9C|nr:nuclear transport factor 2 family protein [Sphingobium sp. MI1205]AMK19636.1 hypothetical protein K663_16285 [Sphingobium sp. MI1205]
MPFTGPIEDRIAIRELLESYASAVCEADSAAWGATWAEEGVWTLPDYTGIGRVEGRDAIVTKWIEVMKDVPGTVFVATPGSIEIDGDRAQVRSYTSEVFDYEGATLRHRGRYEDVVVKRDGGWLFQSRTFSHLHRQ